MAGQEVESVFSHDKLQDEAEKLLSLLKERETTGLFSWHARLNERLKTIHDLLCPLFGSK